MAIFDQARENYVVDRGLQNLEPDNIKKLKLEGNIILGNFIFNTIDEDGVAWVITNISGWWNHPTADVQDIPRGYGDGSYDVQGRYLARSLTLEGTILVPRPELVEAARDKLIAATDLVYKGEWLRTGSNPIRSSFVRLSGDVSIETINARGRTNFSIGLRAPDPIKYSWNDASPDGYDVVEIPCLDASNPESGVGTVLNIGNYPVSCFLEVTGPLVSPATIFNRTTEKLIILTQSLKGSDSRFIVNKQLTFNQSTFLDVAVLTTTAPHEFTVGDTVFINNVGIGFDGEAFITSVPTTTTFTYETEVADIKAVNYKQLSGGIAIIQTVKDHEFQIGDLVTVIGVDSVFDGEHLISEIPTSNTFLYPRTRIPPRSISSKIMSSNIATLTTIGDHQFIVGETVTVSGVDVNFDGSHTITATPSSNQFSYAATRTNARAVVEKSMLDDAITLTTSTAHGFILNEGVNVTGVNLSFNGGYLIQNVTSNTFSYRRVRATEAGVLIKALSSNTATITTTSPHGFAVGEKIKIENVDTVFDGTYEITSLPSNTTFTYSKSGTDLISTSVVGGTVKSVSRVISSYELIGNVATVTTANTHGVVLGETVTITGINPTFNGTYQVLSIPTSTTFTYARVSSNTSTTPVTGAFVEMSGNVPSTSVVPDGLATVSGSFPLTGSSGTASVSETVERTLSSGSIVKRNDVQFTPGLSGATAILSADILEIDTKNREVAFNGEVEGARGRVDVLTDFIQLAPGENVLEFNDTGAPESKATLRVYYRSGWLG